MFRRNIKVLKNIELVILTMDIDADKVGVGDRQAVAV